MRAWLLIACCVACKAGSPAPAPAPPPSTEVHVDRRVELISTVAWLAGYPEYDLTSPSPYVQEVKARFGRFADHPAVAATRALAAEHEISHDAPMALAIHLDAQLEPHDVDDLAARPTASTASTATSSAPLHSAAASTATPGRVRSRLDVERGAIAHARPGPRPLTRRLA